MVRTGGLGQLKEADDAVSDVIGQIQDELKGKVSEKLGKSPENIRPLGYKTQVVAGTNFFVKVLVDEEKVFHARIYKNLTGNVSLHSVTDEKGNEDEVDFF